MSGQTHEFIIYAMWQVVSFAAVFWDVMRDIPKNGCEGDYVARSKSENLTIYHKKQCQIDVSF